MRGEGGVAGEGRVVGVPKFHSLGKCTMPLTNINSDWMPNASSSLCTSVMIYHRETSLSEQHNDLPCTKQDLSHTSRYVDESSPEIARCRIRMPTAKTATLSVTTYA